MSAWKWCRKPHLDLNAVWVTICADILRKHWNGPYLFWKDGLCMAFLHTTLQPSASPYTSKALTYKGKKKHRWAKLKAMMICVF